MHLHQSYVNLPPPSVRWQVKPGSDFLDDLFSAIDTYSVVIVAGALNISPQAVYYMIQRPRPRDTRRWPAPEDLRELSEAWRATRARVAQNKVVRRTSPEYAAVHEVLMPLLEVGFDVGDLAKAIGAQRRQLARFTQRPLNSAEAVARAIDHLLSYPRGMDLPDRRE